MRGTTTKNTTALPLWLFACWALVAIAYIALGFYDLSGDPAISNIVRVSILLISTVATLAWFLISRRFRATTKLFVAGAVALVLATTFAFFDVRLGGDLRPRLTPRFGSATSVADITGFDAPLKKNTSVDIPRAGPTDYPGFLGFARDNQARGVELAADLDARPPQLLWRQPIGEGLAGFAVVGDVAATLEHRGDDELATLYDARTGELLWATVIDSSAPFGGGIIGSGPRATPLIHRGNVYVLSVQGKLLALDGASGEVLWRRDLLAEAGIARDQAGEHYPYGRSSSPVIEDGKLLVAPGGQSGAAVSIAALDPETGETLWQSGTRQISPATPAVATLGGVQQVLVVNEDFVTGHALADGRQLWELPLPGKSNANANVSNAVGIPPDRVFVSKGYGIGSALWELEPRGDTFEPQELWSSARTLRTKFTNVALRDGYVYGLSEGVLECAELASGERAWKGGRYGHGQITLAGDVLVVLTEDGEIVYVEATPESHRELGRFQAIEGQTWNPFALAGDLLVVRNSREAAAYRLATAG